MVILTGEKMVILAVKKRVIWLKIVGALRARRSAPGAPRQNVLLSDMNEQEEVIFRSRRASYAESTARHRLTFHLTLSF